VPGSPLLKIRVDRFSIVPEFSAIWPGRRSEIGVFCHEFGHALGLPDLYDTRELGVSGNIGLGNWSLMATGGYGGDTQSPEYPTHMSAWPMLFLGLSETVRPTADSLITLGAIERGAPIVELWFQGESNPEHFLIENRQREGFDRNLPNEGLIVYQVDDAAIGLGLPSNRVIGGPDDAMRLIQADNRRDLENGSNRGDPSDPFPGSMGLTRIDDDTSPSLRTFAGAVTNLALTNIAPVGDDMRMLAQVQAPGWLPAEEHSMGGFQPVASFGPATRAVRHADGTLCFVGSEIINGRAQVVLRTKTRGETWAPPVTVSQSPGQAFDPTIAAIPGGDIAVVWSDTRHGARELYFRSWLHGVWTPERRLTDLPGDSRSPCLGADGLGGMHLAWQYNESGSVRVQFMYFTYYSPFGDPRPVTAPGELPDAPSLAVDARGSSYVVWSDRATYPSPAIWYAHFHPDSGVSVRRRVFDTGGLPQNGPQAVVDTAGALNLLWQVASASGNEIHYQRRLAAFPPMPRDTIIELRGESVQDPMLAADPQGGLHLVMALSQTQQQIRYKNWQPGRGWDRVSTEVTQIGDGSAVRPTVLAASPGYVTVLYTGYPGGAPQFMERRREYGPSPLTAVASPVPTRAARLVLGRNPLPAGTGLTVRGSVESGPGDRLDLLDLNGRLVASSAVERSGDAWLARWSGQETGAWRSGIYWVRSRATGAVARLVVLR
jgi:hypothetical protein